MTVDNQIQKAQILVQNPDGSNNGEKPITKIGEIKQIMENFMNDENFVLKSRKTKRQVVASTIVNTQNAVTKKYTGVCCNVTALFNYHIAHEVVSIDGKGRQDFIELAKNLEEKIEQTTIIPGMNKQTVIK